MNTRTAPRRRGWARYLMVALLVVPIIEVYFILQVAHVIGGWSTFFLLLVWSALGAWLVKREAGRAFGALRQAFATGRMPSRELADAALILVGGALLLAPGFITDALGLFLILPITRPISRRLLERAVAARLFGGFVNPMVVRTTRVTSAGTSNGFGSAGYTSSAPYPYPQETARGGRGRQDEIVEGEIID